MNEVKRYDEYECGVRECAEYGEYVKSEDFDRVTAERDAALGREDALTFACNSCALEVTQIKESMAYRGSLLCRVQAERDALQQHLTAADERADVLEGLLREVQKSARKQDWASGYPTLFASVDAALKPAEAKLCKTCNGTGIVSEGAMYCSSGGIPFECGPIECVKDCPECTKPWPNSPPTASAYWQ
jgi:hypothetical protein